MREEERRKVEGDGEKRGREMKREGNVGGEDVIKKKTPQQRDERRRRPARRGDRRGMGGITSCERADV